MAITSCQIAGDLPTPPIKNAATNWSERCEVWFESSSGYDEDEGGKTKAVFDLIGRLERGVLA